MMKLKVIAFGLLLLVASVIGYREYAVKEIVINGMIGATFYKEMNAQLKFYKNYHLVINSPGGHAMDTIAVINQIETMKRRGCKFTTEVYGHAMSAGVMLFLMGDERVVHDGAVIMIHYAALYNAYGRVKVKVDGEKSYPRIITLELINDRIYRLFLDKTPMTEDDLYVWMQKDYNYMGAEMAYKLGIATEYVVD